MGVSKANILGPDSFHLHTEKNMQMPRMKAYSCQVEETRWFWHPMLNGVRTTHQNHCKSSLYQDTIEQIYFCSVNMNPEKSQSGCFLLQYEELLEIALESKVFKLDNSNCPEENYSYPNWRQHPQKRANCKLDDQHLLDSIAIKDSKSTSVLLLWKSSRKTTAWWVQQKPSACFGNSDFCVPIPIGPGGEEGPMEVVCGKGFGTFSSGKRIRQGRNRVPISPNHHFGFLRNANIMMWCGPALPGWQWTAQKDTSDLWHMYLILNVPQFIVLESQNKNNARSAQKQINLGGNKITRTFCTTLTFAFSFAHTSVTFPSHAFVSTSSQTQNLQWVQKSPQFAIQCAIWQTRHQSQTEECGA